ncbi:hypothetical protein M4I32_01245 [Microbacterium sp. LRZ72]|uniref:hypothetical protein n=1 Tax=Microbacterium sp. LRZ72 TaxID=2942481 RepID=UPI0029A24720|nr:hypothetical protein [Microbacterium sp. LRZ72]MDX2375426.1 hypothetical protein [Microbacterium sp. LRZ72]
MTDEASTGESSNRSTVLLIAALGSVLVVAYAALAAVQILVLNPLAAAPDRTLAQIHSDLASAGESLGESYTLGILGLGCGLALLLLVLLGRNAAATPRGTAVAYAIMLMFGAPAYFIASFGAGMGLADAYGIGGADHSPWSRLLYAASVLAMVAAVVLAVSGIRRPRRSEPVTR